MTDKSVELRIREHYVADSGEWLVEKGKLKEAKLLKEACETIELLRRQYAASENNYHRLVMRTREKDRELEAREKAVAENEKSLRSRLESVITGMQYLREQMK